MSHRIFATSFASVYPLYLAKVQRKGRSQDELDQVIGWLTGYSGAALQAALTDRRDFAAFFAQAPALTPARDLVTGVIYGVRIEALTDPLMREIRILDKLVDELAKGRPMARILRGGAD